MATKILKVSSPPQMEVSPSTLTPDVIEKIKKVKEVKDLVAWISSEYNKAKQARARYERQWALNMAFYRGQQNAMYFAKNSGVPGAGRLVMDPPAPTYRSRSVTNRIRPIIRTELARLTSNKPNASVFPASSEDMDIFAAQAAEQIWQALYSGKKLMRVFARSAFWQVICGTSFTKDWWDPKAFDNLTKQPGSIMYGVVSPFHLFVPDLYEEEIEDQPYLFNVYTKPASWVEATYGVKVNASVTQAQSPLDAHMMSIMGSNDSKPDSVLIIEAWIKPGAHRLFPEGGYVTLANDTVVGFYEGWMYDHKEYPFTKWEHIPTGMFYSESAITDLIGPQREYNRTKNQIIESKNKMSKPQLMAPKGSITASRITSEPGQIIEYRPGLPPPQPLPLQPIPSYVMQELDLEKMDMEDISAQHAVSRGDAPSGVTAATAISFLQERDDSVLTTTYQSVEHGWEKMARHSLSHVVQFWDVPRTISVTGLDGSFDSVALKGTELTTGTDIRMEAGSALPQSKAAKQAFLLDLMKLNLIPPEKGLELLEMGGIEKLYDDLKIDERQAQRENLRMSRLEIEQILLHEQQAAEHNAMLAQMEQMQSQQGLVDPVTGVPDDTNGIDPKTGGPADDISLMGGQPQAPMMPGAPTGQPDPQMGMSQGQPPMQTPMNIIPVNTWDNHQLHIEVHNKFRKSQAFELLAPEQQAQFEYHVQLHAQTLNAAAQSAMMQGPPPNIQSEMQGAQNGSGTPVGSNQFGPPGTNDGAPPPSMMGQ